MNSAFFKLPTLIGIVAVAASSAVAGQYAGFDLQTVAPSIAVAEHAPQTPTISEKTASLYEAELTRSKFSDFLTEQGLEFVMPDGVISVDRGISVGLNNRPVGEIVAIVAGAFGATAEQRRGVWYFKNRPAVLSYSEMVAPISSQIVSPRDRRLDPLVASLTSAQVSKAGRIGYLTVKEFSTKQRTLVPKHLLVAGKSAADAKIRLPKDSLPVFK
jgi:hypothetical protein